MLRETVEPATLGLLKQMLKTRQPEVLDGMTRDKVKGKITKAFDAYYK